MVLETLRAMAYGGMRDHVGGGFHRYSVDAQWRVPHFEKMLYDQAQLVLAYLEAAQVTGEAFYAATAEDTLDYVLRDLTSPDGAFFSAEDADSAVTAALEQGPSAAHPVEKREGAFYVWTLGELKKVLGDDDAEVAARRFGVEANGNALADPQSEFTGQNILYIAQNVEDIAARMGKPVDAVMAALIRTREKLFEARATRPRPHLDDKIITAWNGLMIAAFARAARVLADSPRQSEWLGAAVRAATWIRRTLWSESEQRLLRRFRDDDAAIDAFCEDYAYLAWGALELFQATGDRAWLDWALALTAAETARFYDERDGGWFSTTGKDDTVLLRLKEDYDGAEPAAASVTVSNLLVLGHLTSDETLVNRAKRTLERYGPQIARAVRVMPLMVSNLTLWHGGGTQIVLVGDPQSDSTRALARVVAAHYLPASVVIPLASDSAGATLADRLPWLGAMRTRDGRATAYVCHDFTCREPATDADQLAAQLDDVRRQGTGGSIYLA
jgi:uncharacterized protein YyaL (SSP411 family)